MYKELTSKDRKSVSWHLEFFTCVALLEQLTHALINCFYSTIPFVNAGWIVSAN